MARELLGPNLSSYQGVLYNVLQQRETPQHGVVIALTSPSGNEGVSYIAEALLEEMEDPDTTDSILVDLQSLLDRPDAHFAREAELARSRPLSGRTSRAAFHTCGEQITALRAKYRFSFIDCPALAKSSDVLTVASAVDGILLVLEADRTRKEQIRDAERQLIASGGRLLGHILNKRKYQLPKWLYDIL